MHKVPTTGTPLHYERQSPTPSRGGAGKECEIMYAYLGEQCPHCAGEGYIRKCPNCNDRDVRVVLVPGMWWEWRCKCGWIYRHKFKFEKEAEND